MCSDGGCVLIVQDGSCRYELNGRVALMVRWLAVRAERLGAINKVAVTFDCAGSRVSAEVKEREAVDAAVLR